MKDASTNAGQPATEPGKLHPGGVLARMKELYVERTAGYMDEVDGEMELKESCAERVSCYLCGGTGAEPFLKASGFRHVRCLDCGLVYVNPRLSAELIEEFYKSDAYNYMFENMLMKSVDYRVEVVARKKFDAVARYFAGSSPRLLDIGCGIGEFPHLAAQAGWQVEAVEFSPRAVAFARERFGLMVHEQPLENCSFASGQFDVATMWGVLEHLTEPRQLLDGIRDYLVAGGLLVVEVPSFDCLLVEYLKAHPEQADRIVDGWGHLMLFSLPTIRRMLEDQGYEVVAEESLGLDIQTILRYVQTSDPALSDHPVFRFLREHGQPLQDCIEAMHKADMIRVCARSR
ncbi:MAG: class I SAM-dependent methyltransferase [Candidatus Latescibacterota bacterium]|nr:class I SAM-dependent methyltransferase [Candidatus Latescibacterota bacterium]